MVTPEKKALELILPEGIFEWFEIIGSSKEEKDLKIILEEKNIPPITDEHKDKKITSKGFTEITITDFPIRGRRTLITFRRRYWQVEGQKELLKRAIKIGFPGTQLEKEFAIFLKDDGGRGTILANFYRQVSKDPSQRI
ncbi:MAG: transposase [Candidatus Parcubacteria bacterium]|nr:transposase [Candidatus Parcubacteria bacterium]